MKRIQNKIAESRFSLAVMIVYGLGIWFLKGFLEQQLYLQLLFFAVSVYLMVELNNSNLLIRIYSRMVSCSFLALTCISAFILDSPNVLAVQLCMVASYSIMFRCYQDKNTPGKMFYAFLFIGLASTQFIQVLFFVPILWVLIGTKLIAFSFKTFFATILGLIVPYWFLVGYYFFIDDIETLMWHFISIAQFEPLLQYMELDLHIVITFVFILILSIIGIVHFLNNSLKDKIRTRVYYEIFIIMDIATAVFIVLQPHFADYLISLMIIPTSALLAHYIALTSTKVTNITFKVIVILILALTVYNLWTPSLPF
ncbi:MAG: hypothetical protein LUC91_10460 [Prevotella sp.]|nr:hypothetical protein [Prevotella sp.]